MRYRPLRAWLERVTGRAAPLVTLTEALHRLGPVTGTHDRARARAATAGLERVDGEASTVAAEQETGEDAPTEQRAIAAPGQEHRGAPAPPGAAPSSPTSEDDAETLVLERANRGMR